MNNSQLLNSQKNVKTLSVLQDNIIFDLYFTAYQNC